MYMPEKMRMRLMMLYDPICYLVAMCFRLVPCMMMLMLVLWQYEVSGHSGEGHNFAFVKSDAPPKNMKDRLDILLASWLPISLNFMSVFYFIFLSLNRSVLVGLFFIGHFWRNLWIGHISLSAQALHAHSQFCVSGDNTLEAAKHAVEMIVKHESDEHFVILLSDANLDRYGIPPKKLAEILTMNADVNAYVIFIGSLGDQAQRWLWFSIYITLLN